MESNRIGSDNAGERYAAPAILFHWISAIFFPGMIALGWYMMSIEESPGSDWYFNLHKSLGLIIALLVLLRAAWRIGHRPHPLPVGTPQWQARASRLTHWLLYAAMIAMPLVGIIGSLYSKKGIALFGLQLPQWFTPNHDVAEFFFSAHSFIAWILVGLIALHVLAALKHLVIDKDGVFQRMWFS
jgi:cytochrome b561